MKFPIDELNKKFDAMNEEELDAIAETVHDFAFEAGKRFEQGVPHMFTQTASEWMRNFNKSAMAGSVSAEEYNKIFFTVCGFFQLFKELLPRLDISMAHQLLDGNVQQFLKAPQIQSEPPRCKKGCSNCCFQRVTVTKPEAELLSQKLTKEDAVYIQKQALIDDTTDAWASSFPGSKCVFLKNGECSVYETRPAVCRTLFAVTDPKACDIRERMLKPKFLVSIQAEMMVSAMFDTYETGNMARMLLKEIEV